MDDRTRTRIENVRDMVLYRHGSTGVVSILQKAVQMMELTPVYIVRNALTFSHNDKNDGVFREVGLAKIGSRIGDIAKSIHGGEIIFIETGKQYDLGWQGVALTSKPGVSEYRPTTS